uniref:Tumor necrosis factor receptor superfamily, member 1a n=1 Tax=Monopterus albus TaxID=43700 RepID=A0A3Q3KR54_MONAL
MKFFKVVLSLLQCVFIHSLASMVCPPGDYATEKGICCNKCSPGFKLVEECHAAGQRSNCTPCPLGQYTDQMNYVFTCMSCKRCLASRNEVQVSACQSNQNTICQCKYGYYKSNIDSVSSQCLKCLPCGPNEMVKQACTTERNTVCTCKENYYRCIHCSPPAPVLIVNEDPLDNSSVKALPQSPVGEQEPPNLPDCVPLEIKVPDLIYTVLDLVPVLQVKQLVRTLGVRDIEIEQAEMDHRSCREAHYQMLRVWTERVLRAGEVGQGEMLHWPLMQELLDQLRKMHLEWAADELETKYGIQ